MAEKEGVDVRGKTNREKEERGKGQGRNGGNEAGDGVGTESKMEETTVCCFCLRHLFSLEKWKSKIISMTDLVQNIITGTHLVKWQFCGKFTGTFRFSSAIEEANLAETSGRCTVVSSWTLLLSAFCYGTKSYVTEICASLISNCFLFTSEDHT